MRKLLATTALAALVAVGAASAGGPTKLLGTVGPGYTISLKKAGKSIKTLKAGTYKFVVADKSSFHNFTVEREHPAKPKIEKHVTSTPFTGSKTMLITLKPGSWRYYCSVHEALMHHDFKVVR